MAVEACPTCRGFGTTVVESDSDERVRLKMIHGEPDRFLRAMERRVTCNGCRGQGRLSLPGAVNIHERREVIHVKR